MSYYKFSFVFLKNFRSEFEAEHEDPLLHDILHGKMDSN